MVNSALSSKIEMEYLYLNNINLLLCFFSLFNSPKAPMVPFILHPQSSQPSSLYEFKFQKRGLHISQVCPITFSLQVQSISGSVSVFAQPPIAKKSSVTPLGSQLQGSHLGKLNLSGIQLPHLSPVKSALQLHLPSSAQEVPINIEGFSTNHDSLWSIFFLCYYTFMSLHFHDRYTKVDGLGISKVSSSYFSNKGVIVSPLFPKTSK